MFLNVFEGVIRTKNIALSKGCLIQFSELKSDSRFQRYYPSWTFVEVCFFAILRAFLKVSVFVLFEELPDAVWKFRNQFSILLFQDVPEYDVSTVIRAFKILRNVPRNFLMVLGNLHFWRASWCLMKIPRPVFCFIILRCTRIRCQNCNTSI